MSVAKVNYVSELFTFRKSKSIKYRALSLMAVIEPKTTGVGNQTHH